MKKVLVALASLLLCAAQSASAGTISYPLLGHFEAVEGTLELWLSFPTAVEPRTDVEYLGLFSLLNGEVRDGFRMNASISSRHGQLFAMFSLHHASLRKGLLPVGGPVPWLRPYEVQHFALIWQGLDMAVAWNGKIVGTRRQAVPLVEAGVGDMLRLSAKSSPVIFHALRLSNVARAVQELVGSRPALDRHTLLLDSFDARDIREHASTEAVLVSGLLGERGGNREGVWHAVSSQPSGVSNHAEHAP